MSQVRRKDEGFALLVVLMMSAGIAIMLYRELPRVAFESMRAKEEMLIERGEQYQRAVQLYVNKVKQYPQSLDDLDKGAGQKYLRRRYKDPFTGKADWTLLKVDAAGVITNSKIKKKDEKKPNQNTFITEYAGIGQSETSSGVQGANIAMRRRPSDGPAPDANGQGAPLPLPSTEPPPPAPPPGQFDPQAQQQQQQQQGQIGQPAQMGQVGQPGAPMGMQQPPQFAQGGQPGMPQQNLPPGLPQGISPQQAQQMQQYYPNGIPNQPGAVGVNNQMNPGMQPVRPGMGGPAGPPMGGPAGPPVNSANAAQMIMGALTSPSPNIPMNMGVGANIGPGIVGVASKVEGKGIKIYNEQEEYDKWEFVYDPRKDKRLLGALAGAMPQPGQPTNLPPGGPMGSSMGSPMGGSIGGQPQNVNVQGPGGSFGVQPGMGGGMNRPGMTTGGGFGPPSGGLPQPPTGNRAPSGPAPIGSGYPPAIGSGYNNTTGAPQTQPQQPQPPGTRQPGTVTPQNPGAQPLRPPQPPQQPAPQATPLPGNRP